MMIGYLLLPDFFLLFPNYSIFGFLFGTNSVYKLVDALFKLDKKIKLFFFSVLI